MLYEPHSITRSVEDYKAVCRSGLVDRNAAGWHLNTLEEVAALNTTFILPARSIIGLAW